MSIQTAGIILLLLLSCIPRAVYGEEHIIERGDTALQIAIDHNLTMDQLQQLNPDVDLEMMRVGDVLTVPDEDSQSFEEYLTKRYAELLRVEDANCEVLANHNAVCLIHLENRSDMPLFDVRVRATVCGENNMQGQAEGNIALMQILPGEKLPMVLNIPGSYNEIADASVNILNLSYAEAMRSSFRISPQLYTQTNRLQPDGISATASIQFTTEGFTAYREKQINLLAAAYAQDGSLIGVRSMYTACYPQLDITVYSVGPAIESVELRMEAY